MDHAMNVAARNTAAEDEFISDGYDIERRLCRKSRQKKNEKKLMLLVIVIEAAFQRNRCHIYVTVFPGYLSRPALLSAGVLRTYLTFSGSSSRSSIVRVV